MQCNSNGSVALSYRKPQNTNVLQFPSQRAFHAVMLLWGRKLPKRYGAHIAELVLSIICHVLKGESVVHEKTKEAAAATADSQDTAGPSSSSAPAPRAPAQPPAPVPEISQQQLQQVGGHVPEALLPT